MLEHFRPDRLALREALRGLRYTVHTGGRMVLDRLSSTSTGHTPDLPGRHFLCDVENTAARLEAIGSDTMRFLLCEHTPSSRSMQALYELGFEDRQFARVVYDNLRLFLQQLGIRHAIVSELAARQAHGRLPANLLDLPEHEAAALIAFSLVDAGVIREGPVGLKSLRSKEADLAIAALLFWLLSNRSPEEDDQAHLAAADMALAVEDEIVAALRERDKAALSALFEELAPHV